MGKSKYNGGCFNVEYGRNTKVVLSEVRSLLEKWNLDFLVIGEARDYEVGLAALPGYRYFVNPVNDRGAKNDGILVKDEHRVTKVKYIGIGDGWITIHGDKHGVSQMPELTINRELKVKGVHAVTPTHWLKGKLTGPKDRVDDYLVMVGHLKRWFWWPCSKVKRICLGDWNERPFTEGLHTPKDIARKANAHLTYPTNSKEGHGIIDYAMWKGLSRIDKCFKDIEIREGSDHEPVIFLGITL